MRVEFVIAWYNEPLDWVWEVLEEFKRENVHATVYLYKKGAGATPDFPGAVTTVLPNVGRESHTYLHHMATAHERPPGHNVTVFMQADPHTYGLTVVRAVTALILQAMMHGLSTNVINAGVTVGRRDPTIFDARYGFRTTQPGMKSVKDGFDWSLGAWFDATLAPHVGYTFPRSGTVSFYKGACFAVHAAVTLPPAAVARSMQELSAHVAPGCGHFFERLWFFLFINARNQLLEQSGSRWRDGLDPMVLETRWRVDGSRRAKDLGTAPSKVFQELETCVAGWKTGSNARRVALVCQDLHVDGPQSAWSWDHSPHWKFSLERVIDPRDHVFSAQPAK